MTTLYQLVAMGNLKYFGGRGTIHSRKVFNERWRAERDIDEFKVACCNTPDDDARSLRDLEESSVVVQIIELALVEERASRALPVVAVEPDDGRCHANREGDMCSLNERCPQVVDGYCDERGEPISIPGRKHRTCPRWAAEKDDES
jgi:hypothetical protein